MVAVQAACSISTAEVLMRYRADLIGCDLSDIALGVVRHRLRFDRDAAPGG